MFKTTVLLALRYPRAVLWFTVALALSLATAFPFVKVDVDPEAMLSPDEPVRLYHNQVKVRMQLYDMIVVGVTRDELPEGVFNPESLRRIQRLGDTIASLDGVIAHELLVPDNVDAIEPAGPGAIRFQRVMDLPPGDQAAANRVRERLADNPFLWETMISSDRKALAFYVPIRAKEEAWRIASAIRQKVAELDGPEQYHITGLPVAEDTFGVEMFIQMAISAPLAMALIGLLIWRFVRNMQLTLAALSVAMLSVLITMGAFVASGNTLHIMSSMIPIFIMPIAVLDAVHILSQFHAGYRGDRRGTLVAVMRELWKPMLFTSLTTSAGFASLLWAPIPPVQVFGLFTALGVAVAWLLSMTFMPAFICLLPERALAHFGAGQVFDGSDRLGRGLAAFGRFSARWPKAILAVALSVMALAGDGLTLLQINDNPTKWFEPAHEIRVADRLINGRFGGSYLVYLSLTQPFGAGDSQALAQRLAPRFSAYGKQGAALEAWIGGHAGRNGSPVALLDGARRWINAEMAGDAAAATDSGNEPLFEMDQGQGDTVATEHWLALDRLLEQAMRPYQIMKQPAVLKWLDRLFREAGQIRGHSSVDLVKKINKELHGGDPAAYRIPETSEQVMETYLSFQNSHDLNRLWHMITPDYASATALLQLRSGDNLDVEAAVARLDRWIAANPPPLALHHDWSGLAYINVVWQEKMVSGMLYALGGSALIVFVMMLLLYRSAGWALLAIMPLSLSILLVYGLLGFLGKDYDMPVAVLSALALGLSVDFAIHFIVHLRQFAAELPPAQALQRVFGLPGRGIFHNAVVITLGFTPLLLAPLVPYQTVGYLMMAIMLISAVATFLILPALLSLPVLQHRLFAQTRYAKTGDDRRDPPLIPQEEIP